MQNILNGSRIIHSSANGMGLVVRDKEVNLSVVFESGIQEYKDYPTNYYNISSTDIDFVTSRPSLPDGTIYRFDKMYYCPLEQVDGVTTVAVLACFDQNTSMYYYTKPMPHDQLWYIFLSIIDRKLNN